MNVLFVLILISLLLALGFLVAFIWSVRSGQYEDTWTPAIRPLLDEVSVKKKGSVNEKQP